MRYRGATLLIAGGVVAASTVPFAATRAQMERAAARTATVSLANIVDLTHTLTPDFPFNPTSGFYYSFRAPTLTTIKDQGSNARRWDIHEHVGTQIDAPVHFHAGGRTLDRLPVEGFVAPLAVIDISERARADPDAEVTVNDIRA